MRKCANCKCNLPTGSTIGYSGLYNPNGPDIILCETCFLEEDDLINENGNNQPERLKHYNS